ncbi:hypothetical protein JCM19237_1920 [Photobacterium aphoticum]|uniref:Hydrogenase maturation nickel metallochaperone HypA n=1 Tax=Photobacterium aphoticum TaxID=754436 RepID=A0A090QSV0_9GAMM|nr:hypothetical protein JCM19237_1920 [Photobacterium aphoticum]
MHEYSIVSALIEQCESHARVNARGKSRGWRSRWGNSVALSGIAPNRF